MTGPHSMADERPAAVERPGRLGGTYGNELLTSATAAVLTALLLAEGVTVVRMQGLVGTHMFIGLALIPPIVLKLASTGYRFVRYYTGNRAYTAKGPPQLPLRVLAPVLVAATIALFTTGVLLLAAGHKSGALIEIHKVSFIVWGALFAVHFLAYGPRVVRSLGTALRATRGKAVAGAGIRGMLVAGALGGGVALAAALLPAIDSWRA